MVNVGMVWIRESCRTSSRARAKTCDGEQSKLDRRVGSR